MNDPDMAAAEQTSRLNRLTEIGRSHGFFRRLSKTHSALFVEEGQTLIVSFDTAERVLSRSSDGLPLGFQAVQNKQYSLLSILSARQSWFRDGALFRFFDELVDEDFFDQFDRVLFLGIGPMCGYGAMAYSVVAPFSRVLAINPVATLSRDAAPFERRYRGAWRHDFTSRYGFAPAMIEAAEAVTLIYDPTDTMSAAHAALFNGSNVNRLKLRHGGMSIGAMLETKGAFWELVDAAVRGPVSAARFSRISRKARRSFPPYISKLVAQADQTGHPKLALAAAEYGQRLGRSTRFDDAVGLLKGRTSPG